MRQEVSEAAYSSVVGARTQKQLQAYVSLQSGMYMAVLPMVQGFVQRGPLQFLRLLLEHQASAAAAAAAHALTCALLLQAGAVQSSLQSGLLS